MNEIRFSNGETLSCAGVYANPVTYLGVTRDALTFAFAPDLVSLDDLLRLTTPDNCAAITITDGDELFVHEHYTIRTGAGVSCRDIALRGGMAGPVQDARPVTWVTMAQSTPAERQLRAQQDTLDILVASALEV